MDADVEAPPRDVELSALEAEKQPMASPESGGAGPEKNGLVKAAGPGEAAGPKFTGLGKEELLRAAAAPGWARARAALLAAFWLGWLGMLGAAAAIVARAPRCHVTGSAEWWRSGGVYRAPPEAFGGSLEGVRAHLDYVASLAGGLLLGPLPLHSTADSPLEEWPPELGSEDKLGGVLGAAKERGLRVLVELNHSAVRGQTPNGNGSSAVERAIGAWLQRGFDGVFLDGIEELEKTALAEFRNVTERWSAAGTPRLLVGGTRLRDPPRLQELLDSTKVSLLLGVLPLGPPQDPQSDETAPNSLESVLDPTHVTQLLQLSHRGVPVVWSVGTPGKHLVELSSPLAPQVLLLLWGGLPNAPVLNYGDEAGLENRSRVGGADRLPPMEEPQEGGNSSQAELLSLSRRLRALRGKEQALAVGGADLLWAGADRGVAVLRGGGAGERFLLLLNPGAEPLRPFQPPLDVATPTSGPTPPPLPPSARLVVGTHRSPPPGTETPVEMAKLQLQPYEGLLLRLPPQ